MSICSFVPDNFLIQAQKIGQLGKGTYGSVDLYQSNNQSYAVKFQNIYNTPTQSGVPAYLLVESDSLVRFRGIPEVIELVGICYQPLQVALIMEQMDTDVYRFIKTNPPEIRIPLATKFLHTMARATNLFELLNITHFDIKTENILVKIIGNDVIFKVTDFGLARPSFQNYPPPGELFTLWYRPPEFLTNRDRISFPQYAGDVWSTALSTVEMLTGNPVVYGQTVAQNIERLRYLSNSPLTHDQFQQANQNGTITGRIEVDPILRRRLTSEQYSLIDPDLIELLSIMLTLNPNQRPTGSDVLTQSFQDQISQEVINQLIPPEYPRQVNERGIYIITNMLIDQIPKIIAIEIYTRFLAKYKPQDQPRSEIIPVLDFIGLNLDVNDQPSPPRVGAKIGQLHEDIFALAAVQIAIRFVGIRTETSVLISLYYQQYGNIMNYISVQHVGIAEKDILTTLDFKIYNISLEPVINYVTSMGINLATISPMKFSGPISTWLS